MQANHSTFIQPLYFMGKIARNLERFLTDAVPKENAEIRTIPAGTYVVGYHKGAYEQIQDSFKRIKEWGRNLNLEDTILALNIIDQFVEQNMIIILPELRSGIADTK